MKTFKNWNVWEKYGMCRVYVGDDKFFERGFNNLPSQVGLTAEEVEFAKDFVLGKSFDELVAAVRGCRMFVAKQKKESEPAKNFWKSLRALPQAEREGAVAKAKAEGII